MNRNWGDATWRQVRENCTLISQGTFVFKSNYTARMMAHGCNPSSFGGWGWRIKVKTSLGNLMKPYLKIKRTEDLAHWVNGSGFRSQYWRRKAQKNKKKMKRWMELVQIVLLVTPAILCVAPACALAHCPCCKGMWRAAGWILPIRPPSLSDATSMC